jgi:hypothetical protein
MMQNKDAFPDKSGDKTCVTTTPSDQHLALFSHKHLGRRAIVLITRSLSNAEPRRSGQPQRSSSFIGFQIKGQSIVFPLSSLKFQLLHSNLNDERQVPPQDKSGGKNCVVDAV